MIKNMIKVVNQTFKKGDRVIIITPEGKALYGIFQYNDPNPAPGPILKKGSWDKSFKIPWMEITFMGHDGFPIKKISSPNDIEHGETLNEIFRQRQQEVDKISERIRLLQEQINKNIDRTEKPRERIELEAQTTELKREWEKGIQGRRGPGANLRGSDPFEIENTRFTLLNPFNYELSHINSDPCYKETLFLESELDEAKGMWFDLPGIYELEIGEKCA